jgi:small-conductance mechanosensitive channel
MKDGFNIVELFKLEVLDGRFYRLFYVIFVLIATVVIARVTRYFLRRYLKSSSQFIKVDPTRYVFFMNSVSAIIYIIWISTAVYSIPRLRQLSLSVFAGAGIIAAIIGFASQQAFSNIISGIFIVIFKPFRVGDRLSIGSDIHGFVEDITLRHTVIQDFDNRRVIIPNSVISQEHLINSSIIEQKTKKRIEFGIAYDADMDKAMQIVQEEAEKHHYCLDERSPEEKEMGHPVVLVKILNWAESSITVRAWIWTAGPNEAFDIGVDLYESVKRRFDAEGIEIPYPHRSIVFKEDKTK